MPTSITTVLENLNGAGFIGLDLLTNVTVPGGKKNPYQGRVKKRVTGMSAMITENKYVNGYQEAVKRKMIQEGMDPNFTPGPLPWGKKLQNTPIVINKGKVYMQLLVRHSGVTTYEVDGQPVEMITDNEVRKLVNSEGLVLTELPKKAKEGEQGGISDENKIIVRTPELCSITELRAFKDVYHDLVL